MGHLREKERNPSHYECIELLLIFIHTSKGSTKWTCLLRGFCDPVDQSAIQSTGQQHPIRQHADGGGIQTTQKRGWRLHGTYLSKGSSNFRNDCNIITQHWRQIGNAHIPAQRGHLIITMFVNIRDYIDVSVYSVFLCFCSGLCLCFCFSLLSMVISFSFCFARRYHTVCSQQRFSDIDVRGLIQRNWCRYVRHIMRPTRCIHFIYVPSHSKP